MAPPLRPANLLSARQLALAWSLMTLIALLAWVLVVSQARDMGVEPGTMGMGIPLFLLFWLTMMIAMMFPSVAPVAITWTRAIGSTVRRSRPGGPYHPVRGRLPPGLDGLRPDRIRAPRGDRGLGGRAPRRGALDRRGRLPTRRAVPVHPAQEPLPAPLPQSHGTARALRRLSGPGPATFGSGPTTGRTASAAAGD